MGDQTRHILSPLVQERGPEGYQGVAALEGLSEEEAYLVTAEAAALLPLDAGRMKS